MLVGHGGQHLDRAVGELDQVPGVVGEGEVLFLGPQPLEWAQVDAQAVALPHQPELGVAPVDGHLSPRAIVSRTSLIASTGPVLLPWLRL